MGPVGCGSGFIGVGLAIGVWLGPGWGMGRWVGGGVGV